MRSSARILLLLVAASIALLFVGASAGQADGSDNRIEGAWAGVLGGRLHLVVTITKSSNGDLGGTLNSVDQHAVFALSEVTVKGNAVRFEVPRVGGVYEGKLSKEGKEISGSWTQTGAPERPLDFKRSAEAGATPGAAAPPNSEKTAAPAQHTPKPIGTLFDSVMPISPVAFKADGKWHLVYELHVANMDKSDYAFTRIEVLSGDAAQKTLVSFSGAELDGMFSHPGLPNAEKVAKLVPGEFCAVFMWVTFDKLEDVPAAISHRISVKIGDYPEAYSVVTLPTSVNKNPVVVISPPLTGSDWVAANGPSNTSLHRRALIPINGHAYISQRFAIDWVQAQPGRQDVHGRSQRQQELPCLWSGNPCGGRWRGDRGEGRPSTKYSGRKIAGCAAVARNDRRKSRDHGNRQRAVRVLCAHAAGLRAREGGRQGDARAGAGAFGQYGKLQRAAFAFSDL